MARDVWSPKEFFWVESSSQAQAVDHPCLNNASLSTLSLFVYVNSQYVKRSLVFPLRVECGVAWFHIISFWKQVVTLQMEAVHNSRPAFSTNIPVCDGAVYKVTRWDSVPNGPTLAKPLHKTIERE